MRTLLPTSSAAATDRVVMASASKLRGFRRGPRCLSRTPPLPDPARAAALFRKTAPGPWFEYPRTPPLRDKSSLVAGQPRKIGKRGCTEIVPAAALERPGNGVFAITKIDAMLE